MSFLATDEDMRKHHSGIEIQIWQKQGAIFQCKKCKDWYDEESIYGDLCNNCGAEEHY